MFGLNKTKIVRARCKTRDLVDRSFIIILRRNMSCYFTRIKNKN